MVRDTTVLNLIHTEVITQDSLPSHYTLGLSASEVNGLQAFGHGGFWGTVVQYFPDLNASISIQVLERDKRAIRKLLMERIVGYLTEE